MRLPAEQQLFLTYLSLIAILTLATSLAADSLMRRDLMRTMEEDLSGELALARAVYDRSDGVPTDSIAELIGRIPGRRVSIVAPSGELLGEAPSVQEGEVLLDDYRIRPEIQSALNSGTGRAVRIDPRFNTELVFLATETDRGDVLRIGRSTDEINASIATLQRGIFGGAAFGVLLALFFSFGFRFAATRPLSQIGDAARALAGGDLSRRVRLRRSDQLGELGSALNTLADELQRRLGQLEGERAEMQALIDAMSEGVLALSPTGALRRANPAARRMFSLGPRAEGVPPEMISRRPDFLGLVRLALGGETVPPRELAGGGTYLLATAHPLPEGGAVLVFLDVSELRRLEGVRRDFVANASHELKTPLTAIRGYSETLAEPDLPPDLVRRFAEVVKANADRLQRIVDDLLDLSRIEAGGWRVDPDVVPITEVAEEAWPDQAAAAKEVVLRFDLEDGYEQVWADPSALRQILANLFSNALRYTPENGTVTVRTRHGDSRPARLRAADETESPLEGWTIVEVQDTGSGIPAAHLYRIFERFYRVDPARSREEGGTGLGLSIVKHLVESHGGWIDAESQVGVGTTIRFALPRG